MDDVNENDKVVHDDFQKEHIASKITYVVKSISNISGSILITSYLVSSSFCILKEDVSRSHLISALFTGLGICTLIVTFFSNKFKVVGCSRLGYLVCLLMLFDSRQCYGSGDLYAMGTELRTFEWRQRLNDLQGAVLVASVVQMFISFIDAKVLINRLRPVSIATTLLLIGLHVIKTSVIRMALSCWKLFGITCFFLFALYFIEKNCVIVDSNQNSKNLSIRNKLHLGVLCIMIVWIICAVFSNFELIEMTSAARTDVYTGMYDSAPVFRFSYPYQWHLPTFKLSSIILTIPAAFISIFEIIAFYHTSRPENIHLETMSSDLNKIIRWESFSTFIVNSMGVVIGLNVTYKRNNFKIRDICCGLLLIILGIFGSLCAFFTMIPEPIIGALVLVVFLSSVLEGVHMLRFVDFKLSMNIYTLGISLFTAFFVPNFYKSYSGLTEHSMMNDVLNCLLSTEYLIGGFTSVCLDNIFNAFSSNAAPNRRNSDLTNQSEIEKDTPLNNVCDCFSPFCA